MTFNNKNTFFFFFCALFLMLYLPTFSSKAMFFDGVTYASIGNNLANGIGSFWLPRYTNTFNREFYGHPPIVFGFLSVFYKILGDGLWIEKLYNLVITLINLLIIKAIWNKLFTQKESAYLPLILFLLLPLNIWCFRQTMLENTMTLFTTLSVFLSLQSLDRNNIYLVMLSGLSVFLGFLCKGPVAMFPFITFAFVYATKIKNVSFSKSTYHTLIMLSTFFFVGFAMLFIFPESQSFFKYYFKEQIIKSIDGTGEVSGTKFKTLCNLLIELLPLLVIFITALFLKIKTDTNTKKQALFFLLIALSASLPILISSKQRAFYFVPSMSFYVLATATYVYKPLVETLNRLKYWHKQEIYWLMTIIFIVIGFTFTFFIPSKRDSSTIQLVEQLKEKIPPKTIIYTDKTVVENWKIIAYSYRLGQLSYQDKILEKYLLLNKNSVVPPNYKSLNLKNNQYELYFKKY